jgi:hypothetical protein
LIVSREHGSASIVHTYVTPYGSQVHSCVVPQNRIDQLVQGKKRCPKHIIARSRVPCLEVPGQRNERQDETKAGKDREEGPGEVGHVERMDGDR